jgi:hypothetical protein
MRVLHSMIRFAFIFYFCYKSFWLWRLKPDVLAGVLPLTSNTFRQTKSCSASCRQGWPMRDGIVRNNWRVRKRIARQKFFRSKHAAQIPLQHKDKKGFAAIDAGLA